MKITSHETRSVGFLLVALLVVAAGAYAATEVTKYAVHDLSRPRPPVVAPPARIGEPPADAIVLFGGEESDLANWQKGDGDDATWMVVDDYMVVPKKAGAIRTREVFGNCQLHIEWSTPVGVPEKVTGQKRSNSGVFLVGPYEVQVLDSYGHETYADGQAAALYGQHPPMVNACRAPGEWQSYDIAFMRPLFDENGTCIRKARITVFHNGVCVHNNLEIEGRTSHKKKAKYSPHPDEGPIQLQDHGNPMRFRNIWVRRLPEQPYLIK